MSSEGFYLPQQIFSDRVTRTFVHTDITADSLPLQKSLAHSANPQAICRNLGVALGKLHLPHSSDEYLRGDKEREQLWWQFHHNRVFAEASSKSALQVASNSRSASGRFRLLFLSDPKHCRVRGTEVGLSDLNQCSTTGDPAIDVATFCLWLNPQTSSAPWGAENVN